MQRVVKEVLLLTVVLFSFVMWAGFSNASDEMILPIKTGFTESFGWAPDAHGSVTGVFFSGSWSGNGHGEVWVADDYGWHLAVDTRIFGDSFSEACLETCSLTPSQIRGFHVFVDGGKLRLDNARLDLPESATGLMSCDGCITVCSHESPDPSLVLPLVLVILALVGAFGLLRCCSVKRAKILAVCLYVGCVFLFVLISSSMIVSGGIGRNVALLIGVVVLGGVLAVGVYDVFSRKNDILPGVESLVWDELEACEEEWLKK